MEIASIFLLAFTVSFIAFIWWVIMTSLIRAGIISSAIAIAITIVFMCLFLLETAWITFGLILINIEEGGEVLNGNS